MRPSAILLVIAVALAHARSARAEQVVLSDLSYVHDSSTTTDSHHRIAPSPGTPADWTRPVDYSQGSVFVQIDVKTKPAGDAPTRFQICFEGTPSYACTDQSPVYTRIGRYTWTTPFSRFYIGNGVNVDWTKGVTKLSLILKDDKNAKPAPENVGTDASAKYMPSDLHVLVVLLSKGAAYLPPLDAGAPDAATTHAPPVDAGETMPFDAGAPYVETPNNRGDGPVDAASETSAPSRDAATVERPVMDAHVGDASEDTDRATVPATGCQTAAQRRTNRAPLWVLGALALLVQLRRARGPRPPRWRSRCPQ
jgi:hypothetical protein